jgi:hypothetical protein
MEEIRKLVNDSLLRHGVTPSSSHGRLGWSQWFLCESSIGMLLAPAKPGIFAVAEEVPPSASPVAEPTPGEDREKRMLAIFQISEADDLGMGLGRLFLPGNPARQRLISGRCFARYAVIEDPLERFRAHQTVERWMRGSGAAASVADHEPSSADAATPPSRAERRSVREPVTNLVDFPRSGPEYDSLSPDFLALGVDRQNQESLETAVCPLPMPSGF